MYWLRTLGGVTIEHDGAPLDRIAAHRKSLALLALLAAQGSASRERLMALLWPESDEEHARGSLKQAIHLLRRLLAAPDVLLGTTELRLNPEYIECDVDLFLRGLAEGDVPFAVRYYGGPFLDGFHLDGTPEFDRWAEAERAKLARRYADALEELARSGEARGEHACAATWWQRLQAEDPLNSRVVLSLMMALEASADHAGALRQAQIHETMLEEELGIAPDPAVAAFAEQVRSSGARPSQLGDFLPASPQRQFVALPDPAGERAVSDERESQSGSCSVPRLVRHSKRGG
jgi:DNA-binding SARP family transcriptional activator